MTDFERYNKYIKEHCINCKNKSNDLCEIRILSSKNIAVTKCSYYERENKGLEKHIIPAYFQGW